MLNSCSRPASNAFERFTPNPHVSLPSEWDITQPSTALRNVGAGAGIVGRGQALHFGMAAKMQGMTPMIDPASPANQLAHLLRTAL